MDLGQTYFSQIRLMKLIASTMLSAVVKVQYSSVLPLLHRCLPVFVKVCGTAMNFVFLSSEYH